MNNFFKLGAMAALGMSTVTLAAERPSHSYVEAGYGYSEIYSGRFYKTDSVALAASHALPANLVLAGEYLRGSYSDGGASLTMKQWAAGLGYQFALGDTFSVVTSASYEDVKIDTISLDGFGLSVGTSGFVTERLELGARAKYRDLSEMPAHFTLSLSGRYYLKPRFSVGIDVVREEAFVTTSHYLAKLRYDFGR